MPLICKYRWRGMAKSNLRKLTKTANCGLYEEMEMWEQAAIQDLLAFEKRIENGYL